MSVTHMREKLRLNGFQLKVLALIVMTIDHVASFLLRTTNLYDLLRIIGRIAAPLFLYLVVEGLHHTRSKPKYILRLYLAGVVIGAANRILEVTLASDTFSMFGNILPTFFHVAFFVYCIETILNNRNNVKRVSLCACGLLIPFVLLALNIILSENSVEAWTIVNIFFPSLFTVDFSILFVIMGIIWYFTNNKYINCVIFAVVCLLCFFIPESVFFTGFTKIGFLRPNFFNVYLLFSGEQGFMILAIPFMLLYNGEKGLSFKYFFYCYYPLHQYLLFFIAGILNLP